MEDGGSKIIQKMSALFMNDPLYGYVAWQAVVSGTVCKWGEVRLPLCVNRVGVNNYPQIGVIKL